MSIDAESTVGLMKTFTSLEVKTNNENEFGVYISNDKSYVCLSFYMKEDINYLAGLNQEDLKKTIKRWYIKKHQ
jgi:hypothetical protein